MIDEKRFDMMIEMCHTCDREHRCSHIGILRADCPMVVDGIIKWEDVRNGSNVDKMEKPTMERLIYDTKRNIQQLLYVGLQAPDAHIKEVYGGESELLNLIRGYFCLLEDLQAFKYREEQENKSGTT